MQSRHNMDILEYAMDGQSKLIDMDLTLQKDWKFYNEFTLCYINSNA